MELIRHRRSVKPALFASGEVEESVIDTMLESARWAPTHAMTQPWRFVVYSGTGIEGFIRFRQELYKKVTPPEQFNALKYEKIRTGSEKCSHIILMGMKRQATQKLAEWEELAAVSSAAQNMQLVATAMDTASYWSTGAMSTHPGMLELLGLSDGDKALGMLMIGRLGELPETPVRTEVETFTRWVRK